MKTDAPQLASGHRILELCVFVENFFSLERAVPPPIVALYMFYIIAVFFFFLDIFVRSLWHTNDGEIQSTILSIQWDDSSLLARYFGAWSFFYRFDSIESFWKFACFAAYSLTKSALLWSDPSLLSILFCQSFKICLLCCTNRLSTSSSSTVELHVESCTISRIEVAWRSDTERFRTRNFSLYRSNGNMNRRRFSDRRVQICWLAFLSI